MDSFKKTISVCLLALSFISGSASAVYPAGIRSFTYCFTTSGSYSCSGPMFGSVEAAAKYACQQLNATHYTAEDIKTLPLSSPQSITSWSAMGWEMKCKNGATGVLNSPNQFRVQALPDCGFNSPIANHAPASCVGDPPPPVALTCSNTNGLTITAFHAVPVLLQACYSGCRYNAVMVGVVTYNGMDYSSGSWSGVGEACEPSDSGLIGGIPGNAQNVGGGGGLSANDLLGLARESTLQQLLLNAQQSTTAGNQNTALLQSIKDSTALLASKADPVDTPPSDPDGLEGSYQSRLAAVQVDASGKLPDAALSASSVDVGATFTNVQGFIATSGCPVAPSFTMYGSTYSFDLSILCSLGQALSYLVVAVASLSAIKIFTGGM